MSLFGKLTVKSLTLAVGVVACGDDNPVNTATSFTATLSGANEVPPVTTAASGTAEFTISGGQIEYTVNVTGIENVLVAHIHTGREGQNGPVRLNLCGTGAPQPPCTSGSGVLATGTNGTTVGDPPITFDELVEAMRSDSAYANVHTQQNQAGEIRGQIVPQ
jgi:CHRD domain-containing protein